jgi:hypothetical protein
LAGRPDGDALPLGLRNRLAELILEAFDAPPARRALEALASFCRSEDGRVGVDAAERLAAFGCFAPAGSGRVQLLGTHRAHRDALCRRAAAAWAMLESHTVPTDGSTLLGLLTRAAWLADAGLYFEVHELLEPAWFRAEGAERVALQGLIQVAVAFHHLGNGNRDGAVSLLSEGLAKLETAGAALALDASEWIRSLGALLTAWRAGTPPPPIPGWPTPSEAARRST